MKLIKSYILHNKSLLDVHVDDHQQHFIPNIFEPVKFKIFMQYIIFSECPIGYHRNNCSEKCSYPVYGEDCQYICDCNKNDCHFVTGCFNYVTTVTDHQQLTTHFDDYLPHDIDLIKDNSVVRVIISLIGVFVFFFAIFVLTYIYFKCFRKTTTASGGVRENEGQAQYKSLNFDEVEPQIPIHQETQEIVNTDFTYLTPVFSCNDNKESRGTGDNQRRNEKEILPDTHTQAQRLTSQETTNRRNVSEITHDGVQEHVYIEISEEMIESSK